MITPAKGRGDAGVVEQRLDFLQLRVIDMHLLFRGRQIGFGGGDLRFGHQVLAVGVVDFLLGDQSRLLFGLRRDEPV